MDTFFEIFPYIIALLIVIARILSGTSSEEVEETPPQTASVPVPNIPKDPSFDGLLQKIKQKARENKAQQIKTVSAIDVVKPEKGISETERKKDQHFAPYQITKRAISPYAKLLKNKDSFKQAFILSEILNKKYF